VGGLALAFIVAAVLMPRASGEEKPALVLTGAIPLPNVKGRIDHFGIDATHNRLFVSALGNNTEEIIGISAQAVVHSISGVPTPQGVVYSPETNKLFVGSAKGKLYIYDGSSFDLITSIDFGDEVDGLRYEAGEKRFTSAMGMKRPAPSGWSMPPPISGSTRSSNWERIRSLSSWQIQARTSM
jgi:hypothetical protein